MLAIRNVGIQFSCVISFTPRVDVPNLEAIYSHITDKETEA